MAQPLNNWSNGIPILPLDSGHKGDLDIWANGAPAVKNPKKDAKDHAEGLAATSAVGTLTASIAIAITLTGLQTDSATGTVSVTAEAAIDLTGQQCDSATGTTTQSAEAASDLTGVEAVAEVGSVEVTATGDVTAEPALGGGGGSTTSLRKYWRTRRRPDPVRVDVRVKLRGIEARGEVGQVRCHSSANVLASARHALTLSRSAAPTVNAGANIFLLSEGRAPRAPLKAGIGIESGARGARPSETTTHTRVRAIRNPTDEELLLTHLSLIE